MNSRMCCEIGLGTPSLADHNISKPWLLETNCTLLNPTPTFSFPLRNHSFHLGSASGQTDRFSGALRQQYSHRIGFRSRHEGLHVPSNSTTVFSSLFFTKTLPAVGKHQPRGANEANQAGVSPSVHQQCPQSQHISTSAVNCPVYCTLVSLQRLI